MSLQLSRLHGLRSRSSPPLVARGPPRRVSDQRPTADHQAHLVEAARILNGLDKDHRRRIRIEKWDEDEAYARVTWLFAKLCHLLKDAPEDMDAQWFANRLTRAAIPARYFSSRSVAVDGTDIETWVLSRDLSTLSSSTARLSRHN